MTICQQSLVTAAVLAVGVSAAGVKTLDLAPPVESGTEAALAPQAPQPDQVLATPPASGEPAAEAAPPAPGALAGLAPGTAAPRTESSEPSTTVPSKQAPRPRKLPATAVETGEIEPTVKEIPVRGVAAVRTPRRAPAPSPQAQPTTQPTVQPTVQPSAQPSESTAPAPTTPPTTEQPAPAESAQVAGRTLVAQSAPEPVTGYATVGVTWSAASTYADDDIAVQVRTRSGGSWSEWTDTDYHSEHGPQPSEESGIRPGTDELVIGDVDDVQMRAGTADGSLPADLKLAVIDPGSGRTAKQVPAIDTEKLVEDAGELAESGQAPEQQAPEQTETDAPEQATLSSATTTSEIALTAATVARPTIYSRAQWGANEAMRDRGSLSYGTIQTGFVHHTVNANTYTAAQVPSLLRGIYAYHTQSRGWSDIGYNFLVDRFGRIWEGRYGGVDRPVVGAHTLGYNEVSFAMSAIGNFDTAQPPAAMVSAYARLFAWKLSLHNINAANTRIVVKGRALQAINGHRDAGSTACPGRYLYAKLPQIRSAARALQLSGSAPVGYSPTQAPRAAVVQPPVNFPGAHSLVGSGWPDIAASDRNGAVWIYPTGGQQRYDAPATSTVSWSGMSIVAAVGDVTGDGRGDVMAKNRATGATYIYPGNGAGRISASGHGGTLRLRMASAFTAAGDWNGDRRGDILFRDITGGGRLMLLPRVSPSRFGNAIVLSARWRDFLSTAAAGDLNRDGRPDVVGKHRNGYLYAGYGTGAGTIGSLVRLGYVGSAYDVIAGAGADLTGDRIGDVMLRSTGRNTAVVLKGTGRGTLGDQLGPYPLGQGAIGLTVAQMSGSASADVVALNAGRNGLLVYPHNGRVNLGGVIRTNISVTDGSQLLNVGDWNRDGRGDLMVRRSGGDALQLYRGRGNGTFEAPIVTSRGWRSVSLLSAVGDVTADGRPDLVGAVGGVMRIFPGSGGAGFYQPMLMPGWFKTYNKIGVYSWQPGQMPGSGVRSSDGSFVPFGGTAAADSTYDWTIGTGDVDGNGIPDVIARERRTGALYLRPGARAGFGARWLISSGFGGFRLGG